MDYIINPMWFYWINIADAIKQVSTIAAVLFAAAFIVSLVVADGRDDKKKMTVCVGVACAILAVVAIFVPSKQTLIEMQIARYATKQNVEIGIDAIKSATDYVIEAIKSLK